MVSDTVLDFDQLLEPISEENPAGDAFRVAYSAEASKIKALRDESSSAAKDPARYYKPVDGEEDNVREQHWDEVFDLCKSAIAEKSKDLRLVAWLIEAAVRLHGFAGLRDGLHLGRELCERYWSDLHPRPDADEGEDISTTMEPLTRLNGEDIDGPLVEAITSIPVTAGQTCGPFSLWDRTFAQQIERQPGVREQLREPFNILSLKTFETAVAETPAEHFQNVLDDIAECRRELAALDTLLDEKCGRDDRDVPLAPSTSRIRKTLEESLREVCAMAGISGNEEFEQNDGENSSDQGTPSPEGRKILASQKGIQSREDAFNVLTDIARFFKHTEPHSPISYALEQIVRWGKMSLPDLLTELVRDSNVRDEMFRQVGIPQKSDEEDG